MGGAHSICEGGTRLHSDADGERQVEVYGAARVQRERRSRVWRARGKFHSPLVFVQVLIGNVIFQHLVRANFALITLLGIFHTGNDAGFERVPFLEQFVDTF